MKSGHLITYLARSIIYSYAYEQESGHLRPGRHPPVGYGWLTAECLVGGVDDAEHEGLQTYRLATLRGLAPDTL
jgi:hypothetical protein